MARTRNQGSKWIQPSTRLAIYARDGFCCAYCGARAEDGVKLTLDHLLACELGGTNKPENLVTACLSCNSAKCDRTMADWFAKLGDKGVDTDAIGDRLRTLSAKPLDRAEGRRLLAARKASKASTEAE